MPDKIDSFHNFFDELDFFFDKFFYFDKSCIFVDEFIKLIDMIILIFLAIIIFSFVGLRGFDTSSASKKHHLKNKSAKNSVYDLSGKNYSL
ncbi:MAG: hypothetical protein CVT95_06145 [Bacteroidetes bacterium HGW-Bacteroidetes-12]|nr:MAG: hypothetical protein CVT95_06145 [Bacteroidetes bacterium HGW-Bacteroidetes-12]